MKSIKPFKRIVFAILFCCLLVFRSLIMFHNLEWHDEVARDQIYAKLMIRDWEQVTFGHWNSGIGTTYPPYYYFVLSGIRLIYDSYEFVLIINAALNLILCFFVYKIAKLLGGPVSGILAFTFALISPLFINMGLRVWSAYFPVAFCFAALYLVIKAFTSKHPNNFYFLLGIMITSLASTIFYAAVFQLIFLMILIISLSRKNKNRLFFLLTGLITFFVFNTHVVSQLGLIDFIKINFGIIFSGNNAGGFNVLANSTGKPEMVIVNISIALAFAIHYFFSAKKSNKKLITLLLFLYYVIGILLVVKTGIFHHGILQYPLFYILTAIFIGVCFTGRKGIYTKIAGVLAAMYLFYSFFPLPETDRLLKGRVSRYHFFKNQILHLTNPTDDSGLLTLSVFEKDGKPIYWQSLNFWYYDVLENPGHYALQPRRFCSVTLEGVCYLESPNQILLVCPQEKSRISSTLRTVSSDLCKREVERISTLVGNQQIIQVGELNYISVDENKYIDLKDVLLGYDGDFN